MELPQEYWSERILREIAGAIGTPLIIDTATKNRVFGHYARILVDIDFSRRIFYEILVERDGFAFKLEVEYEWLPDFCSHCQMIGHDVLACRWLVPQKVMEKVDRGKQPANVPKKTIQKYVEKENTNDIRSSKAFEPSVIIPTSLVITHIENVVLDENVETRDVTVLVDESQPSDSSIQDQQPLQEKAQNVNVFSEVVINSYNSEVEARLENMQDTQVDEEIIENTSEEQVVLKRLLEGMVIGERE